MFCSGGARPPIPAIIASIDHHLDAYGVEPICRVSPIALSTYDERVEQRLDLRRLSARARRHAVLKPELARVFAEHFAVYGARKVWRQIMRQSLSITRSTVARRMRKMGLAEVIRDKPVRTTISEKAAPCPLDHVKPHVQRSSAEHAVGVLFSSH